MFKRWDNLPSRVDFQFWKILLAPFPFDYFEIFWHQSVFNTELVKLKARVRFEPRIKARSAQRAVKVKPPWGKFLKIQSECCTLLLARQFLGILEAGEVLSNVRTVENAKKANWAPNSGLTDTECNWWPLQWSQHCSVQHRTLRGHTGFLGKLFNLFMMINWSTTNNVFS